MNYTDTQLKQALAKMLPEQLRTQIRGSFNRGTKEVLLWLDNREVLDTELLHLCWLVEETLNNSKDSSVYTNELIYVMFGIISDDSIEFVFNRWRLMQLAHATLQQRTIALAKVKRVEIV